MAQNQNNNRSQIEVPQAKQALDRMKYEVAGELGINLQEYNPQLTAYEAGKIGGNITQRLIKMAEQQLSGQQQQ